MFTRQSAIANPPDYRDARQASAQTSQEVSVIHPGRDNIDLVVPQNLGNLEWRKQVRTTSAHPKFVYGDTQFAKPGRKDVTATQGNYNRILRQ
jgi:hypothetical protein